MTAIEVRDLRTETSKTYRLHTGAHRVLWSSHPLHIRQFGHWEDINTNYLEHDGHRIYHRLPYLLDTYGPELRAQDHDGDRWQVRTVLVDQPAGGYVMTDPFTVKSEIPFKDLQEAGSEVRVRVTYAGVSPVVTPEEIQFWAGDVQAWGLQRPVLIDAAGEIVDIPHTVNYPDPYGTLELVYAMPEEWLADPGRAWPIVWDPKQTYTSDLIYSGNTRTHTTPSGITITPGTMKCRWKGVSVYQLVEEQKQATKTASCYNTGTGTSLSCNSNITLDSGQTYVSGYRTTKLTNQSGQTAYNVYIAVCGTQQLICSSVPNGGTCTRQVNMTGAGSLGACTHVTSCAAGGSRIDGFASVTYNYIESYYVEYKSYNPKVTVNGKATQYSGYINNGVWTALQTMTAGSLVVGSNSMSFNIGGSGRVYYYMEYEYTSSRPTPLKVIKIKLSGSTVQLPLISLTDPGMDSAGPILRVRVGSTTYCADLVATSHAEASAVRVRTQKGTLAWRKWI